MPLVQRSLAQGKFFRQDDEPTWEDGDLWSDTNLVNTALFINNNGTPLELGTFVEGDNSKSSSTQSVGTGVVVNGGAGSANVTDTVTPVNSTNEVILCAAAWGADTSAHTTTIELREGVTILSSTSLAVAAQVIVCVMTMHVESDVDTAGVDFNSLVTGTFLGSSSTLTFVVFE